MAANREAWLDEWRRTSDRHASDVSRGRYDYLTSLNKFGRNFAVGTSFEPVSINGVYRTPQVADAKQLRVKAGNAADAPGGAGAHKILLRGLDPTGAYIEEEIETGGAAAGPLSTKTFLRCFGAEVSESGTYATIGTGSHVGDIVIEDGAGNDWQTITATGFPRSESLCSCYTVPLGKRAYVGEVTIHVEGRKTADVILMTRDLILDAAPPYKPIRTAGDFLGLEAQTTFNLDIPQGIDPLTDIIFLAKFESGNDNGAAVLFQMLLEDE